MQYKWLPLRQFEVFESHSLDHVIVFHEASLYRRVKSFLAYYHESRTHLSLAKDTPEPRRSPRTINLCSAKVTHTKNSIWRSASAQGAVSSTPKACRSEEHT